MLRQTTFLFHISIADRERNIWVRGESQQLNPSPDLTNAHAPSLLVNRSSHVTPRAVPRDRIVWAAAGGGTKSDTVRASVGVQVSSQVS